MYWIDELFFWVTLVGVVVIIILAVKATLVILRSAPRISRPLKNNEYVPPELVEDDDDEIIDVLDEWLEPDYMTRYLGKCPRCLYKGKGSHPKELIAKAYCPKCWNPLKLKAIYHYCVEL